MSLELNSQDYTRDAVRASEQVSAQLSSERAARSALDTMARQLDSIIAQTRTAQKEARTIAKDPSMRKATQLLLLPRLGNLLIILHYTVLTLHASNVPNSSLMLEYLDSFMTDPTETVKGLDFSEQPESK